MAALAIFSMSQGSQDEVGGLGSIDPSIQHLPQAWLAGKCQLSTQSHVAASRSPVLAGQTLLVLGAAGGVGLAAVQLGKVCAQLGVAGTYQAAACWDTPVNQVSRRSHEQHGQLLAGANAL